MAAAETKIEDYAFLSDTQTGALVSRDGCVDWLCFPRFDSGACFASLLGTRDNGHWRFWPKEKIDRTNRRYRGERSEEHTSELQSHSDLVCRLLLEKKNTTATTKHSSSQSNTHTNIP